MNASCRNAYASVQEGNSTYSCSRKLGSREKEKDMQSTAGETSLGRQTGKHLNDVGQTDIKLSRFGALSLQSIFLMA